MNILKKTLSFFLWYVATAVTILIVAIFWLAIWQDIWLPTMLGNRILAISLLIAAICEGLRRQKGTNERSIYSIFPITVIIFGLAGWLLRYPVFAVLDLTLLSVSYLFFIIFLLSTHGSPISRRHKANS